MRLAKDERGFTLIEILVAVMVIGILLLISIPNFARARERTRTKSCVANLHQIDEAKDHYATEKGKRNGDEVDWEQLVPEYIKTQPTCPAGNSYTLQPIGQPPECPVAGHELY